MTFADISKTVLQWGVNRSFGKISMFFYCTNIVINKTRQLPDKNALYLKSLCQKLKKIRHLEYGNILLICI